MASCICFHHRAFPLRIKRHRIHQVHDRKLRNLIQNLCYHAVCLLLHQAVDVPRQVVSSNGAPKTSASYASFYGVKEILIRHKYIVRRLHPHRIRHVESGASLHPAGSCRSCQAPYCHPPPTFRVQNRSPSAASCRRPLRSAPSRAPSSRKE